MNSLNLLNTREPMLGPVNAASMLVDVRDVIEGNRDDHLLNVFWA